MTLETVTRLNNPREPAPNEMLVLDFANLFSVLRGFPFDSPRAQQITFIGHQDQSARETSWKLVAGYAGRETVEAGGRSIECHKLALTFQVSGPMSLFAGMVPRTYYWFSAAKPHYCVKYTGVSGPPGSPVITRLITSYSGW